MLKSKASNRAMSLGAAVDRSEAEMADAVAELQRLDVIALQRRWRSLVGRPLSSDLGRPLTVRILAYKLQAQRHGDLDRAILRELASLAVGPKGNADPPRAIDPLDTPADNGGIAPRPIEKPASAMPSRIARPGTMLVREHGGVLHRVMVLEEGVAWNGRTYGSLSQVAFAITGTRWNGPRFFGLRASVKADAGKSQSKLQATGNTAGNRKMGGQPAVRRATPQGVSS